MFEPYLKLWDLQPDGEAVLTQSAHLLPVRWQAEPAMLKIAMTHEEQTGGLLMRWWHGDGAARVFASSRDAILLERATGPRSLMRMAQTGEDEAATHILCDAVERLHHPRRKRLPVLTTLDQWFSKLEPAAEKYGGMVEMGWNFARKLLAGQKECVVLHGDIHHCNVLDFGARGWLAIDPKGLFGERYFDYANIFTNPDLSRALPPVGIVPENFRSRLIVVTEKARLERIRLLYWIVAWCALSAAWFLDDRLPADTDLAVAELALAELNSYGIQP